jgi:coenzyme F420-reducing hydrogenase delta subunit
LHLYQEKKIMAKTIRDIQSHQEQHDSWKPSVRMYCCDCASGGACKAEMPDGFIAETVPCTGKIDVQRLMKAFETGADGVFIIGCPPGECKMVEGSQRAAKRSIFVRKMLDEIGIDGSRIEMILPDSDEAAFLTASQSLLERIQTLGPSQLNMVNTYR